MDPDWKNIPIEKILNYEGAHTGEMNRLDRIMQHRTIEAMNGLSKRLDGVVEKLVGLMETIYRVGQLGKEKGEDAIKAVNAANASQEKQQRAMKWLTAALVVCTVVYTIINGCVAIEMRDGNKIQRVIADAAKQQSDKALPNAQVRQNSPIPQSSDHGY